MEEAYIKLLEAFDKFIELYEKENPRMAKGVFHKLAIDNVKQNIRYIKEQKVEVHV